VGCPDILEGLVDAVYERGTACHEGGLNWVSQGLLGLVQVSWWKLVKARRCFCWGTCDT